LAATAGRPAVKPLHRSQLRLPLYHRGAARSAACRQTNSATKPKNHLEPRAERSGGEGRVRTSVARRRQVYSLLRLTALPPPRYLFFSRLCLESVCRRVPEDPLRSNDFGERRQAGLTSVELAEGFEPPTG